MDKKITVIESILNDLNFEIENLEEKSIYTFIMNNIDIKGNPSDFCKNIAVKLISCELHKQDLGSIPSFDIDTIFNFLAKRSEEEYAQIFRFYYGLILDFKIDTINDVRVVAGTNFKIELNLFLEILSSTITSDLEIVLQKVKMELYSTIRQKDWYTLLGGKNCDKYEKERIDSLLDHILDCSK